jgi:hydroxymethylbilane synthase
VDTRVGRLHETGEHALDGIVLAFAGLKRLYADAAGQKILQEKLRGVKWLVLPLTTCPGAPGQGALAIEARADDTQTQEILKILTHAPTAARIQDEMDVLRAHGGGCHQKFGVVSLHLPNMAAPITLVRGHDENNNPVDETRTSAPDFSGKKIWSGKAWTRKIFDMQRMKPTRNDFTAIFAANSRAVPADINRSARLWTSGTPSWFHLADQGLWVEGAADGFGFDFIREFLTEPVLQLPPLSQWGVYTHVDAAADWQNMHIEATYKLVPNPPPACIAELRAADVVIWASGSQFDALHPYVRADAQHVAGPGKTAEHLLSQGIKNLVVMPLFD